jgi:hypothetical protein
MYPFQYASDENVSASHVNITQIFRAAQISPPPLSAVQGVWK